MVLLQLATPSTEALIGWGAAIVISLLNYKIKLDVQGAMEKMRREFGETFLALPVAGETAKLTEHRINSLEKELKDMRDKRHSETSQMYKQFLEEFRTLMDELIKFSKSLAAVEHTATTAERMIHDHASRISDLERKP